MLALHDLNEFFKLSALLNYQLSASVIGRANILATILDGKHLAANDRELLFKVVEYLEQAYAGRRRRLGPLALLHPLRACALLARAEEKPEQLDLLAELLHDKFEDILPSGFEPDQWQGLEAKFTNLLKQVDSDSQWYLMERLDLLTRREGTETYYQYIGRLLDRAPQIPQLVRVKLADRLDNTLDMRIGFRDPLDGVDFFESMFQLIFLPHFTLPNPDVEHPPQQPLNGARRLYELFKNTVVYSLVRQRKVGGDPTSELLLNSIAHASIREAQRIVMHIFTYHLTSPEAQRALLDETLAYSRAGGMESVTPIGHGHRLDGLFIEWFDHPISSVRKKKLDALYANKEIMVLASMAFICVFQSFLSDPTYNVIGVSSEGIRPGTKARVER